MHVCIQHDMQACTMTCMHPMHNLTCVLNNSETVPPASIDPGMCGQAVRTFKRRACVGIGGHAVGVRAVYLTRCVFYTMYTSSCVCVCQYTYIFIDSFIHAYMHAYVHV